MEKERYETLATYFVARLCVRAAETAAQLKAEYDADLQHLEQAYSLQRRRRDGTSVNFEQSRSLLCNCLKEGDPEEWHQWVRQNVPKWDQQRFAAYSIAELCINAGRTAAQIEARYGVDLRHLKRAYEAQEGVLG